MPPLPAHLVLLLVLLAASASASAAGFTCTKPSTCQSAVIGYVVPNATTYEELISRFSPTTLHDLLAANQLPSDTATKQVIPAKTTLTIPFRCRCSGNGVGQSDLYAGQNKFDHGLVNYQPEIVSANNIAYDAARRRLWLRLPCSCDKVDGVRNGRRRVILHEQTVKVHYISGYRKRRLGGPTSAAADEAAGAIKGASEHFHPTPEANAKAVKAVEVVLIALLIAIILSLVFWTCYYWLSACKSLSSSTNSVIQFDYGDLARATHRFSNENMIGEGQYGVVYKATINGEEVVVKKQKTRGKTRDFHHELQTISNLTHTNLVRLIGWCGKVRLIDGKSCWKRDIPIELLIVFEWIPNGTLGDHLRKKEQVLPWDKRYKILKGIGSALRYLHHHCKPCILHRDIKLDNILLDNFFNAKLADFGLSMITCKNGATVPTCAKGSSEYMDPQYMTDGFF